MSARSGLRLGLTAALLGIVANIVLFALPVDPHTDLDWLFKLRGPRTAPDEVLIIGIDQDSADGLELPDISKPWPRSQHAQLVNKLTDQGAGVIVFDMYFEESRNAAHDNLFAQALRRAGNVVLYSRLRKRDRSKKKNSPLNLFTERQHLPIDVLAQAALGWGPFPLPQTSATVTSFWLFKEEIHGAPTLPVVALHAYALTICSISPTALSEGTMVEPDSAEQHSKPLIEKIKTLRSRFQVDPQQGRILLEKRLQQISTDDCTETIAQTLFNMYQAGSWRYLDFYAPNDFDTIAYQAALQEPLDVRGKAVFVGLLDPTLETFEEDAFQTAFSQGKERLFGVEIAATAFANLLENRRIWTLPQPWYPLPVIAWGLLLGLLVVRHSPTVAIGLVVGLTAIYLGLACWLFDRHGLWLPLMVPLLCQAPATLGWVLWRTGWRTRQVLGVTMPAEMAEQAIANPKRLGAYQRQINGICLATDIAGFTKAAESIDPYNLKIFKDEYLSHLITAVNRHNGTIVDMAGDAMIAVWDDINEVSHRRQACQTALDILNATRQLNHGKPSSRQFPTRIGVHHGEMSLGNVGAHNRYQYGVVGDPVVTASRIQSFGKQIGVCLLVSQPVLAGLHEWDSRELGHFRLAGKTQALTLFGLLDRKATHEVAVDEYSLYTEYQYGLKIFRERRWDEAYRIFSSLAAHYHDGPSDYYRRLCRAYMTDPPPEPWDGAVAVEQK